MNIKSTKNFPEDMALEGSFYAISIEWKTPENEGRDVVGYSRIFNHRLIAISRNAQYSTDRSFATSGIYVNYVEAAEFEEFIAKNSLSDSTIISNTIRR